MENTCKGPAPLCDDPGPTFEGQEIKSFVSNRSPSNHTNLERYESSEAEMGSDPYALTLDLKSTCKDRVPSSLLPYISGGF